MKQFLFYIFCIPPIVAGFLIMGLLYRFVLYPLIPSVTALIIVALLVCYVVLVGVAFALIGTEKLFIQKFYKEVRNQENINLL